MKNTTKRNKMKLFTIGLLALSSLSGCDSDSGSKNLDEFMVDISEFTINDSILKDGDYVEILGSSGNLTRDHEIDFYNLVVVRSEETGDTINILVTNYYQADLNNSRTRFMSNSSNVGKIIERADNSEDLNGKNVKDINSKSFKKVFYDSEYIQVEVREYPAISGNLGDFIIEGNINEIGI